MSWLTDPVGEFTDLTRAEQGVTLFVVAFAAFLFIGLLSGGLGPSYFLFLVGLASMYALLSLGLNSQWGFTGLINFSVAAFFGIGAYGTVLLSASSSPVREALLDAGVPGVLLNPVVGLVVAIVVAGLIAVAIGIPTLRLRADYLAIASLGLAEVIRLIVLNQQDWTNGSAGVRGIPSFFVGWPVLSDFPSAMPEVVVDLVPGGSVTLSPPLIDWGLTFGQDIVLGTPFWRALLNVSLVLVFLGASYGVLRRVHRSPWGRVLRTIRADEDLARALGKDTYSFKMQSFVLGSLVMALAGVFYAHLNLYVSPGDLDPITTFYVWVAVILGGSGSNRGALFGGFVVVAIREGTRFFSDLGSIIFDVGSTEVVISLGIEGGPMRLLLIGVIIVVLMRFRPEGLLPPQRELIWPGTVDEVPEGPDVGVRDARGGTDE
ncbi:branched-chain amino acid ABC transporter permease [Haloarchaeobius iranensis]|uniref:Branched-chain amino acid transport system permease protein n=1 Tax=Haloarchaeobius iranensis TaxID=996166 RepID=A0A1G9Y0G4_9EURY|nr:branched-chain amino acid ABC transporter permease [Haloarchaeobius iranensis]SDN02589.1 branched-chain amino acid transport system permease protein [Haloarchaeobius iranensis]